MTFLGLIGIWAMLATIPAVIAQKKGRSGVGFWIYGFLLLPVALVHAVFMKGDDGRISCPACSERILPTATICPHCRSNVKEVFAATPIAPALPPKPTGWAPYQRQPQPVRFSVWHVVIVAAIGLGLAYWSGNFRF